MSDALSSERHQRLYDIFTRACVLDANECSAFLKEACEGDPSLRREVEQLLVEDDAARASQRDGEEESSVGAEIGIGELDLPRAVREMASRGGFAASPRAESARLPEHIGRYRILGILGEGGMGTVYRAEQDNPHRTVALKVIRSDYASDRALRRFELEAQALAMLHHPGIAQIYEAGTFESSHGPQPYFAMELVEGWPLLDYAEHNTLGTRERLALLMRLCDAMEHAHRKGVIHRDLKPANIMVVDGGSSMGSETTRVGAPGQPKILDFGVARVTDADLQPTLATQSGQMLGTLAYMSPEQVAGDPREIDTRADVYALGVIAYELLSSRLPYPIQGRLMHEAARMIREEEPMPLSSINRVFRGDLETIFARALEKDRTRRYQSAAAFGEDIRRFLFDEPIIARKPSTLYQFQKFARRNKVLVAGVAAVFIVLVLGILGTAYGLREALRSAELAAEREREAITARDAERAQRALAEQRETEMRRVVGFQTKMLGDLDVERFGRSLLDELRRRLECGLTEDDGEASEMQARLETFDELRSVVNESDLARTLLDQQILNRAVTAVADEFETPSFAQAALQQNLGVTYFSLGLYDKAEAQIAQAVGGLRAVLGDRHPETLTAIVSHAVVIRELGRIEQAEALHREALAGREATLGSNAPETLSSMSQLAVMLQHQGRLEEAEQLERAALEGRLALHGDDHADVFESEHNLGGLMLRRRAPSAAEAHYRRAYDGRRRLLGEDHPKTLVTLNNLAVALQQQAKYEPAAELYAQLLERRRRLFGDEHPTMLRTYNNYARLLQLRGDLDGAERNFRRALDGLAQSLGPDHYRTLLARSNLANVLLHRGRLDEAEQLVRPAFDGLERAVGPNHRLTVAALSNLADVLVRQGMHDEAAQRLGVLLERRRSVLGEQHPETIETVMTLSQVLRESGRSPAAVNLLRAAVERPAGDAGASPEVLMLRCELLAALVEVGSPDAAVLLAELSAAVDALPAEEPSHAALASRLADCRARLVTME